MRITLAVAVACLTLGGLAAAGDAAAAIRKETHIPAEGLGPALTKLAKEFDFQVLYRTEIVSDLKSPGAMGALTSDEALSKVLTGTGLTYKYLDDKTVTIVPNFTADSGQSAPAQASGSPDDANTSKEVGKKASQGFRVAQLDQGKGSNAPSVAGQSSTSQDNSSAETGLSEIIVTAQKRAERLQDVPISISVVTGADLDKSTLQAATDILNLVPGVTASASAEPGQSLIVIRGVGGDGAAFAGTSPIAYYLDTIPFGFVKDAFSPDPNVYDLKQIEVLRGPQGTLYGANAENGVVRILTNDANLNDFELKIRTLVSATEYGGGNYGDDVAINVPIVDGKLAIRGVVDYQDFSGWINSQIADHANDSTLRNYRVKINAQPTDDLSIGLSAWRSRDNYGGPNSGTDNRQTLAVIREPTSMDYDAYGLKVGYEFPYFSLSSSTSYLGYRDKSIQDLGDFGFFSGVPFTTLFDSWVRSEELILNSKEDSSWRWTGGLFLRNATDRLFQILPGILVIPEDYENQSNSYAVFGQIGRRFLDSKLEWTLGARYFHDDVSVKENDEFVANVPLIHETASFHPITPRAVLTWYPNSDLTAYASYSEGFRSGFPQDPSVVALAPRLPPAQPDKLYNYEIGAKGNFWDRRLTLDAALYFIDWKDIQQSLVVPYGNSGAGVTAIVNGSSASGLGVDVAMTVRPTDSLQLRMSFSWNDLTIASNAYSGGFLLFAKGERVDLSPEYTGGVSADYSVPIGGAGFKGRLSASANYHSYEIAHTLVGPTSYASSGQSQVFARASLSLDSPYRWTATLFVDNLTNNNNVTTPLTEFSTPDLAVRIRPRTVGVHFDYKY